MSSDKFNDTISRLLDEGRINHVIDTLLNKCKASLDAHPDLVRVISALDRISDTYGHLRKFLVAGNPDPARNEIYTDLKEQLKSLGRQYLFIINEDRLDPFFSEYRLQKVRNHSVEDLLEQMDKNAFHIRMAKETEADLNPFEKKREELIDSLFRKVWSLPPWAKDDRKALVEMIGKMGDSWDSAMSFPVVAQVISALLLGLLKFNDPKKLAVLVQIYNSASDEKVAARALTAIVLVLGRWGSAAVSTPFLKDAFTEMEESLLTYSRLRDVVMTLIRTRDTDRVTREVSDAFNTTMREISPEMLEKLQREGLTSDSAETGMNPEWEKLLQNKDIEDRMKAINDMQLEGMDVMMQTFSRLKSFPFFRSVSNWFVPFTSDNSAVAPLFETFNGEGFKAMADATDMCASDRYSFALGIMQMPEQRRNMLAMTLGSQLEALKDLVKDASNVRKKPEFATEALVFSRDLYRFAKLFPKQRDFYDPFDQPMDFLELPLLGNVLDGDDIILTSADFYFRHGYYPQALSLYLRFIDSSALENSSDDTSRLRSLYERIGYCYQMTGDISSALVNYEKADLFSTDADSSSVWLMKKLAFCNKALGRYPRAAEYYQRLMERHPDDLKLEFHLGSVFLRMGNNPASDVPDAFRRGKELISKVHYLNPEHKMAARIYTRIKGHEAFLEGRYKDALSLYENARGDQPTAEYHRDLASELRLLNPDADILTLKILLDE